jgi:hypothetical protein
MAAKRKDRSDLSRTPKVPDSLDLDELPGRIRSDVPTIPGWQARIDAAQEVTHYTTRDGRVLARIRYGDEPGIGDVTSKRCYDCGVLNGQYHVRRCGVERCPSCLRQYWSCSCNFAGDEGYDEDYGTTADYLRAFKAVRAKSLPASYLALLRAHSAAPHHTATWAQLAVALGYANGGVVNLLYSRLSERVGPHLGFRDPPLDFWPYVLVRWAAERDPTNGDGPRTQIAHVLRRPAIEALQRLGLVPRGRKKAGRTRRRT